MKYELFYIISANFADPEIQVVQGRVADLIKGVGGEIFRDENLGKLRLAYPIKNVRHGTYVLVYCNLDSSNLRELDNKLKLSEDVLRYTLVKLPKNIENKKFELTSYVAPLSAEGRAAATVGKSRVPIKKTTTAFVPTVIEETTPKMSVEELDKKLDEILESDVLKDL